MQGEGQTIVRILQANKLECLYNPRPTLRDLQEQLRKASSDASVIGVHFIGHGTEEGLYFVSDDGKEPELVESSSLIKLIRGASSIEFVLVNACNSESLGRELRGGGMKHVSCWRGSVHDTVAERFSEQFYKTVIEKPGDYQGAFDQGKVAAEILQNAKWHNGARKPDGTPCFFSMADNIPTHQGNEKSKEAEDRIRRLSKTEKENAAVMCKVQGEEIEEVKEEVVAATPGYCSNEEPVVSTQTPEPAFPAPSSPASIHIEDTSTAAREAAGVVVVKSPHK